MASRAEHTKQRILDASLRLFNARGETHVTTNQIADELGISPGNLYYHFRSKDRIVGELFGRFEKALDELAAAGPRRDPTVEDLWFFLHLVFETVRDYRFLFRDLDDILCREPALRRRFSAVLGRMVEAVRLLCQALVVTGQMQAAPVQIEALAENIGLLATHWLGYDELMRPGSSRDADPLGRGVFHAMELLAPCLRGEAREWLEGMGREYLR